VGAFSNCRVASCETGRIARIDRQLQVGSGDTKGIVHIACAWSVDHDPLDAGREPLDDVQIGADDANGDRRGNRGSIHELFHVNVRSGIAGELGTKLIQPPRSAARAVFPQLHEDLRVVERVGVRNHVVVDLRIAPAEIGEPALHLGHAPQVVLHEAQGAVGFREARAVGRLHGDQELRGVRLGEELLPTMGTSAAASSNDPPIATATVVRGRARQKCRAGL
jgi:hypothetical protein